MHRYSSFRNISGKPDIESISCCNRGIKRCKSKKSSCNGEVRRLRGTKYSCSCKIIGIATVKLKSVCLDISIGICAVNLVLNLLQGGGVNADIKFGNIQDMIIRSGTYISGYYRR